MKKTILYVLLNTALCLGAGSCRKDTEQFRDYPNSLVDLENLLLQVPDNNRTSTFVLSGGGTVIPDTILTTPGGVRIFLADTDALFREGTSATPLPVSQCQSVRIEVTEVRSKSDLVARGISTFDDTGALIECPAAIRLRVKCDNRDVSLMPDRYIKIQTPASQLLPSMRVFNDVDPGDNYVWKQSSSDVFWADWPASNIQQQTGYEMLIRQLDWVCCARRLEAPASTFCLDVQPPFSPDNTRAFLLFVNNQTAVELLPQSPTRFCSAQVPVGYQIRVLTVSKTGPVYWLGEKSTETGTDSSLSVKPVEKTELQVLSALRNL